MHYPPVFDIYLDALYRHVHQCLQNHTLGLARYDCGSLVLQAGMVDDFIDDYYPSCPPVHILSLDRRAEQMVPDELEIDECTGHARIWTRNVSVNLND